MIEKAGFIGLGLIGGSIAKAMKKNNLVKTIIAYDIDTTSLELAKTEGIVDFTCAEINSDFKDCTIIFLCCPVQINIEMYKMLSSIVSTDCLITDVGSTKDDIMQQVLSIGMPIDFIGGHPMTGSEKHGYNSSSYSIFENAYYILTPSKNVNPAKLDMLSQLVCHFQSLPIVVSSKEHDYFTAAISHVPHVLASILVSLVKNTDSEEGHMHTLAAGGFKDITRIASACPTMWQQICLSNKTNIIKLLNTITMQINDFIIALETDNFEQLYSFFDSARTYRDSFQAKTPGALIKSYELTVDVIDEPGIIANISTLLSNHSVSIKNIGIINNREDSEGVLEIVFYDENSLEKSIDILTKMQYVVYKH